MMMQNKETRSVILNLPFAFDFHYMSLVVHTQDGTHKHKQDVLLPLIIIILLLGAQVMLFIQFTITSQ